jgi:CheY-like chemotaxis protein
VSRRVLVVEDRDTSAEVTGAFLAAAGWEVDRAADGARALAYLDGCRPDVVLLDLLMPGMDGITLLRELSRRPALAGLPVVVLTAADGGLAAAAKAARPGVRVLSKPTERDEILRVLAEAVGGEG